MSVARNYRYWLPPTDGEPGRMVEDELIDGDENYIPRGAIVMFATGFTDHTGKIIYDKDVVRFTNPAPGAKWRRSHGEKNYNDMLVAWHKKRGMWALYWRNAAGELCYQSLGKTLDERHAVAGNAYENPELAK